MRVRLEKPPFGLYERAEKQFGVVWEDGVVFTVSDIVYSPYSITPDLLVHEKTHEKQQRVIGTKLWWEKYFDDEPFRLEQELEAYRAQYAYLKATMKDREKLFKKLHFICSKLSGTMYGNIISYSEAMEKIKNL